MHVQLSTEFALHGLLYLATLGRQSPVQLPDVAAAIKVKESYLRKLFQLMTRSGLLDAYKGAGGGYVLRKTPDEITLYDVLQSIEGEGNWFRCYAVRRECDVGSTCPIHSSFNDAFVLFNDHLRSISLEQIMRQEAFKYSSAWGRHNVKLRAS
ncbi:MAG: Rrf2 family transcriptional regulator [bacterium]|nr:Rrf2 family transcriptional regulator [bacterium]